MRKLLFFTAILFLGSFARLQAQHDVFYSQFYAAPTVVNPAFAGAIESDLRAYLNYRDQWGSTGDGYTTFGGGIDTRFELDDAQFGNNFVGAGLNVYSDQAGPNSFKTTKVAASGAYAIDVGGTPDQPRFISLGFQLGFLQRTLDDGSTWGNQWVGTGFDQEIPSNEGNLGSYSRGVFDLGAGITWYNSIDNHKRIVLGASVLHANAPDIGFLENDDHLYRRYNFTGQFWLASKDGKVIFWPAVMAQFQGPSKTVAFGGEVQFEVQQRTEHTNFKNNVSLGGGAFYRIDDAVYFVGKLNYKDYSLGLSYDVTTSDLTAVNNGQGGFELVIGYRPRFDGSGTNRQELGNGEEL